MRYSTGDEVVLRVSDNFGYHDKIYSKLSVVVVGVDNTDVSDYTSCLCYIPCYEKIPYGFPTFTIDQKKARRYECDAKFVGEIGCFITAWDAIFTHKPMPKGERCAHCNDFFEGVAKGVDGYFFCRACRENPWR